MTPCATLALSLTSATIACASFAFCRGAALECGGLPPLCVPEACLGRSGREQAPRPEKREQAPALQIGGMAEIRDNAATLFHSHGISFQRFKMFNGSRFSGSRFSGSVVQWFSGSAVQRFSGSAVQRFSGSVVQWFSGSEFMEELIINISGCVGGISSTVASVRQFTG